MVAEAIGKRPEQGREDQLGREERGREDRHRDGRHGLAAVLRQVCQVVDEHRAGQARAESERQRAQDDGPDRACHRCRVPGMGRRGSPRMRRDECRPAACARPARSRRVRGRGGAASPGHRCRPRHPPIGRKRRRRRDRHERRPGCRDGRGVRPRRRRVLARVGRGGRRPGRAQRVGPRSRERRSRPASRQRARGAPLPRAAHDHRPRCRPIVGRRPRPLGASARRRAARPRHRAGPGRLPR